jgi:hypothetical protein
MPATLGEDEERLGELPAELRETGRRPTRC